MPQRDNVEVQTMKLWLSERVRSHSAEESTFTRPADLFTDLCEFVEENTGEKCTILPGQFARFLTSMGHNRSLTYVCRIGLKK